MSIGDRVKQARKDAKLTQDQLAQRVGITQPALSDLEKGKSQSSTVLASIAAATGVSALWLETGKGDKHAKATIRSDIDDAIRLLALYRAASQAGKEFIMDSAMAAEKESASLPMLVVNDKP